MFKYLDKYEEGYPKVNDFVLLLFCGYVVIWYLQIGYRIPALGAIRIEFVWALVLIFIALFTKDKPNYLKNPLSGIVVLFFLSMLIQIPFSYVPDHSWNVFFNRVVKFAFMAFFIVSFVRSPKGLILFIGAFMLACMKMGQEGFVGQLTGSMVWQNQGVMRLHGSTPNYLHPNSFSGMALGTIPFILYLFPLVPRWLKVVLAVQFVFACNIILYTGSRTGYVAFFIMIFFWLLFSQKKILVSSILVVSILIGYQYIDEQYIARFNTIFTGQEIEGNSIGARRQILDDAVDIFLEHPFGVGISAFPAVRMSKFGRFQDTHNLYLEVATNLGFQGVVVFCIFIYSILKNLRRIYSNTTIRLNNLFLQLEHGGKVEVEKVKSIQVVANLKLLSELARAVSLFIIIRLGLGLFGMDLYEIYWWFILGLAISLNNIIFGVKKSINI